MSTATLEQKDAVAEQAPAIVKMTKNKKDVWVVNGPVSLVVEGQVTVNLKNGTTTIKTVVWVGNCFDVADSEEQHRYGYLEPKDAAPAEIRAAAVAAPADAHDFMPDDFTPDESLPTDLDDGIDWED